MELIRIDRPGGGWELVTPDEYRRRQAAGELPGWAPSKPRIPLLWAIYAGGGLTLCLLWLLAA